MRKSRQILCAMFGLHLFAGFTEAALRSEPRVVMTIFWLPLSVLLFMWCKSDMAERGIPHPPGAAPFVGLLAPLGVPYYFFRALPWHRAAIATGLALCAFIGMQATWQMGTFVGGLL